MAPDTRPGSKPVSSSRLSILLIDDDPQFLQLAGEILSDRFSVDRSTTVEEALELLAQNPYSAILTDLEFHPELVTTEFTGVKAIAKLHHEHPELPIIVLSKTRDVVEVADAFREGAFHFITKHFYLPEVVNLVERAITAKRLEQEVHLTHHRNALQRGDLIYKSPCMVEVVHKVERFARSEMSILITGESGTGKELVAQEIHRASRRKGGFHTLNAASFSGEIFESLLYGYEKGAFTGANTSRPGLLEIADGGTILLDEIGAVDLERQARLLRLLDGGKSRRLGSSVERDVNLRFVFATNEDLESRVRAGSVRADFWHRVSRLKIGLPPLRERDEDVLLIAQSFLSRRSKNSIPLAQEAAGALLSHDWPGNVRELQTVLESARLIDEDGTIGLDDLQSSGLGSNGAGPRPNGVSAEVDAILSRPITELLPYEHAKNELLNILQRRCLDRALALAQGNMTKTAELLGISRQTLYTWIHNGTSESAPEHE